MKRASVLFLLALSAAAQAKVSRLEMQAPVPVPAKEGAIAYERIDGIFYGALDPKSAGNRIITDIALAPRNANGKIDYRANVTILRPIDPAKRSGVLFYQVANRGGAPMTGALDDGHTIVFSGWQGDIPAKQGVYWASLPVAKEVTGKLLVRMLPSANAKSLNVNGGLTSMSPRPQPVSLDTVRASLAMERKGRSDQIIASADWAFADCDTAPFPGTPNSAKVCLRAGIDPNAAYRLSYIAKDPPVLGTGWAATRDLVSHLRESEGLKWAVGVGDSQSGNFLRSFVHLGFNADEDGKRVFDGINPNIAARQLVLNLRFGAPSGAAGKYEPGSEGVLWWGHAIDTMRKPASGSLLGRCKATNTCPKIIETFGSAELWGLRASPGLVGTDAKRDIPLPPNVRRYYFPSVTHGGSFRGGFSLNGDPPFMGQTCLLPGNPNPIRDQMRVARRMLVDWVKEGKEPLPSAYPTLSNGDLVEPTGRAMGWPSIPGAPRPDGHINPFYDYDFGPGFRPNAVSGVMTGDPPRLRLTLPQRVPRVDADGNETSGIPSVYLQVPLGTYTGWNEETKGYHVGENCGFAGGFIPFARTKSERLAKRDPRLSLEERYGNHAGFVTKIREAAARAVAAGWLFPDDAERINREAEESGVLK